MKKKFLSDCLSKAFPVTLLLITCHTVDAAENDSAATSQLMSSSDVSSAAAGGAVQEVTITSSRKRAESIQSVPTSIKAFSAKALEDANVTEITDFMGMTPNASIVKSQSAGVSFITIRGLSQVRNGDPPVAFVLDGISIPNSKSFTLELSDLQSVEILRGPQGAIYGRNAPGGAIVITTKPPSKDTSGYVEAGAGTGKEYSLKTAIAGSLVPDRLQYRFNVSQLEREGYLDNIVLGKKMDPFRDTSLNGLLRWFASDDLSLDLRFMRSHTTGGANNFVAQTIKYDPNRLCQLDPSQPFGGPAPNPDLVSTSFCSAYIGRNFRDIEGVSLKADYQTRLGTATVILGYNGVSEFQGGTQYPYTSTMNLFGFLNGSQTQYTDDTANSLEFRFVSPDTGPLRWLAGMQWQKSRGFISTSTGKDTGNGFATLTTAPRFNQPDNPTLSWLADTNHHKALSAFGNLDYSVSAHLTASAGFRYDRDQRSQDVAPDQTGGLPAGCSLNTPGNCVNRADYNSLQPTASLRYKLNDDTQLYATFGKGYRSGLFNQNGTAEAAAAAGINGVKDRVDPETTTSFEVGIKHEAHNWRMEAALFRSEIKGAQYFLFVPSISAQVLANINQITLTGGELELAYSPLKGLDLYSGLGITQSRIDAYRLNPSAVGNWAPYVPSMSANLGAQYRFPVSAGLNLMLRGDFISKGKQYWDPENNGARSTLNLLNLHAGLEDSKGKWSLRASISNLTNKRYNEEFVAGGFAAPANPRTFKVSYRHNF